jgi:hypothetical protein
MTWAWLSLTSAMAAFEKFPFTTGACASGSDTDAAGEAEVETSKDTPAQQEIEFSIRNLEPGAVYTFVIDGQDVGTATADQRGRAELEVESLASSPGQH